MLRNARRVYRRAGYLVIHPAARGAAGEAVAVAGGAGGLAVETTAKEEGKMEKMIAQKQASLAEELFVAPVWIVKDGADEALVPPDGLPPLPDCFCYGDEGYDPEPWRMLRRTETGIEATPSVATVPAHVVERRRELEAARHERLKSIIAVTFDGPSLVESVLALSEIAMKEMPLYRGWCEDWASNQYTPAPMCQAMRQLTLTSLAGAMAWMNRC